jgi:hypothetical protein
MPAAWATPSATGATAPMVPMESTHGGGNEGRDEEEPRQQAPARDEGEAEGDRGIHPPVALATVAKAPASK